MKKLFLGIGFVLVALAMALSGCDKFYGTIERYETNLLLFGEFTNTINAGAELSVDNGLTSPEIQFGSSDTAFVDSGTNRINIEFRDMRFYSDLGTYQVDLEKGILVEELNEGEWEEDPESFLTAKPSRSLDVVLVIDVSSSLGSDVALVKQYASQFVEYLFSQNSNTNTRIGVIGFSEGIVGELGLSSSINEVNNAINGLQEGLNATTLYEAMNAGVDALQNSTAEGLAVVTFTDGRNNSFTDQAFATSDFVYSKLVESNVSSYTIGFTGKGSVDEQALSRLAVGGLYAFPETTDDLLKVFNKFANSVSSTYLLTYDRNVSEIVEPVRYRFTIPVILY